MPTGQTAIVQHISLTNDGEAADVVQIYLTPAGGPLNIAISLAAGAFPSASAEWSGKLVLEAGDVLSAEGVVWPWEGQVSGALLDNT